VGFHTVRIRKQLPTFRRIVVSLSSESRRPRKHGLADKEDEGIKDLLKDGNFYQQTRSHIPQKLILRWYEVLLTPRSSRLSTGS
jgi:hypothetical protein